MFTLRLAAQMLVMPHIRDPDFRRGKIYFSLYIPNDGNATMSLDNIELRVPETAR
jgi:hypothetical protein